MHGNLYIFPFANISKLAQLYGQEKGFQPCCWPYLERRPSNPSCLQRLLAQTQRTKTNPSLNTHLFAKDQTRRLVNTRPSHHFNLYIEFYSVLKVKYVVSR